MIDEKEIENKYRGLAVDILFTVTTVIYWAIVFGMNLRILLTQPRDLQKIQEWLLTYLPKWILISLVSVAAGELIGIAVGRQKAREMLKEIRRMEMRALQVYSDVRMSISRAGDYLFLKICPRISGTIEEEIEDIERSIKAAMEDYGFKERDVMSATVYISNKEDVEAVTEWARSWFGSKRLKLLQRRPERGKVSVDVVVLCPEEKE